MNIKKLIMYPRIDDIKCALFIQPHPDDNEIGAGGLMANLVSNGVKVYSLTVTQGDGGSTKYTPKELREIRKIEAINASTTLGVDYLGDLGFNNHNPGSVEDICQKIVEVIRRVKPNAIFSVDPHLENECHPVHLRVGQAVMESFIRCNQEYYPFDSDLKLPPHSVEILGQYFTKNYNTVIDVTNVMGLKMKAIKEHKSQINEEYAQLLQMNFQYNSLDTEFKYAEKYKLLGVNHTHCLTLDIEKILNSLEP